MVVDDLASATQSQLDQWELRPDGQAHHGPGSMTLPVALAKRSAGPAGLSQPFPLDSGRGRLSPSVLKQLTPEPIPALEF